MLVSKPEVWISAAAELHLRMQALGAYLWSPSLQRSWCVSGQLFAEAPIIRIVKPNDQISLSFQQQLVNMPENLGPYFHQSSYGQGTQTKKNLQVRHAMEVDASDMHLPSEFEREVKALVSFNSELCQKLSPPGKILRAELKKMCWYPTHGHFQVYFSPLSRIGQY
jgi:hypothetical protein